jgi:hypothetical protein
MAIDEFKHESLQDLRAERRGKRAKLQLEST